MMRVALLPLMLSLLTPLSAADVPIRKRAVDLLILRDGTRLLGAIVKEDRREGTDFLVRAQWLSENAADLLTRLQDEDVVVDDVAEQVAALVEDYVQQIEGTPRGSLERIGYLKERLASLQPPEPMAEADLVLIRIPSRLIRQRLRQTNAIRELATAAVLNRLDDVENRSRTDVIQELRQRPRSELMTQIPGDSKSSDPDAAQRQFRRLLVATDRAFGQTSKLILLNGEYVSERGSSAQIQMLTTKMMMGQVQSQLQDLLNEGGGPTSSVAGKGFAAVPATLPATAKSLASAEQADVVEVAQMQLNPTTGSAAVRLSVYHRATADGDYRLVTSVVDQASSADITPEQKQRIQQDSRVQQVTTLFGALGSNGTQLTQAISIGAAVEVAQQRARTSLEQALSGGPAAVTGPRIRRSTLTDARN